MDSQAALSTWAGMELADFGVCRCCRRGYRRAFFGDVQDANALAMTATIVGRPIPMQTNESEATWAYGTPMPQ